MPNKLNTPKILLLINTSGLSIDLSTCVSAAKLNIACGLYFFKIFEIIFIKNHLSNLNHKLPNQYILFKKNIISFLEKNEQNN